MHSIFFLAVSVIIVCGVTTAFFVSISFDFLPVYSTLLELCPHMWCRDAMASILASTISVGGGITSSASGEAYNDSGFEQDQ